MKSTIKVVLFISLFTSTALLTLADGETGQGNRCETGCMSIDDSTMQSYEVQPVTATSSEPATPVSSPTMTVDDGLDDELLLALWMWFSGFPL